MDLIHAPAVGDVVDAVRAANEDARRLLVVGGRRHIDKGNPCPVDGELWTTQLDRVVAYEPAEMVAVVQAGMRVGELSGILAGGGQEWPADAPPEATVGGVIAAAASSPRRLRVGAIRDTVLETEAVTGQGRLIRSGGRTVKNVTGYDLHKLLCGSLGTLGVIVQVALKLRPLPKAARTISVPGAGLELGLRLLDAVPLPAAVMAGPDGVELRLEGWPEEVEAQTEAVRSVTAGFEIHEGGAFPLTPVEPPGSDGEVVVEAAVPPSRIPEVVASAGPHWRALLGVGLVWIRLANPDGELAALRERAAALGGVAPAVKGPGGLGDAGATPPAIEVHRRLKRAFDPNGVLAPGRFWGGL